ncbi:MAG: Tol-Pal system protein TolB [Limnobacter sp.]|nr:Tol-Pal system protein TolB [Limnobacter sp.]
MKALFLALLSALLLPLGAAAQMRIDVSGVGATQYPIAIARFAGSSGLPQDVPAIVGGDLSRSGAFRVIDVAAVMSDADTVDHVAMRERGADAVLTGSVTRLPDGRYEIRYRLSDAVRQAAIGGESLIVGESDLRFAAHRIADWVFERLTGEKGIFSTRIAYVSKQGERYRLNIADWDGENIVTPLNSPEPIISPSWSRDGSRIAYVSFEARKPVVYVHTLATGQRKPVANFKGSNSAPAWSPDGRSLAVALTIDGLSQIYLVPADGGGTPRRITSSTSIDTEPVFSPDGQWIYFTSDRGGSPQIYRMSASGGDPTRITFTGNYNVSPRISPDGRSLAYVTRRNGGFVVIVRDLASGNEVQLSDGGREESPSFAPNGRWVMYATGTGGRDSLVAASVDGRVRQRLTSNLGDIREPTWGPFAN